MTIRAKYRGTCTKCGGYINVGDSIEWERGKGSYHTACPEKKAESAADAPYKLHGGEGYGCYGWEVGQVVRSSERQREQGYPEFLVVVTANSRYYREDGMSFGVGDDSGRVYWATAREATVEESAPLRKQIAEQEAQKAAETRRNEIARQISEAGERPDGDNVPEGERISDRQDVYGGGDWFVIGPVHIWYVKNNGMDGDNWSYNNVRTGGAGAIGWRVAFNAELADELRDIASVVK